MKHIIAVQINDSAIINQHNFHLPTGHTYTKEEKSLPR